MSGSFVLLHGATGFVDELVIVVAAFLVLWLAIRLSGRKTEEEPEDEGLEPAEEHRP